MNFNASQHVNFIYNQTNSIKKIYFMQQSVTLFATLTKIHHHQARMEVKNPHFECSQNGCFTNFYVQKGLLFQSSEIKGECGTKKGQHQVYCCRQCYLRKFI
ncbi:unnamed protein product [Paramecium pentaurelia]|uniref:Uncharacterized protein n=1 Tax=Paramecium pentaurelia TaxID=43138 RepID=A0A8S1VY18_9CILI|nr:unnamed protein product [Paramecium pentaurelia]